MSEDIPQNWKMVQLEEVAAIMSGGTPSRDKADFWGHDIPWVTPTDITNTPGRYLHDTFEGLSHLGLSSSSASLLPAGTILMTSRATVGDLRIAEREVCTNQGFKSLVPKKIEALFLFYQMQENREAYKVYGIGSTFLEVNKKDTGRFNILVPNDLQVQQKIGRILDTIDQTIEKTEALIHKYQQIKAGLMHDLFTRGLTAGGKLRPPREQAPELYQETPIGWIPKEWEAKKLENIVHFQRGHDIVESKFMEGDFPVVSSGGVIGYHNQFTTKAPNVVIGRKGTIGKVHFLDVDFWAHDTSLYATDLRNNEPRFVFYLCVWLDLGRFGTKSGSPSLNRNDIHPINVACPQIDEQKRINKRLVSCDRKIKTLNEYLGKLVKVKSGLMHDLLTGKVPVKVAQAETVHV
jgi:type I restriction enzyme S subunit